MKFSIRIFRNSENHKIHIWHFLRIFNYSSSSFYVMQMNHKPNLCVPDVLGALAVWRLQKKKCVLQNNNLETKHKNNTPSKQHQCVRGPSRECRSIRSGSSGLPYYCTPLVCVSAVIDSLAVWRHNKPKTQKKMKWRSRKIHQARNRTTNYAAKKHPIKPPDDASNICESSNTCTFSKFLMIILGKICDGTTFHHL